MPPRLSPPAALALALAFASACARPRPVQRDECDRLLARYTEMLAASDGSKPTEIQRKVDEARARAASHRAFQRCTEDLSREQIDCALQAFNPDEIERCLVPVL